MPGCWLQAFGRLLSHHQHAMPQFRVAQQAARRQLQPGFRSRGRGVRPRNHCFHGTFRVEDGRKRLAMAYFLGARHTPGAPGFEIRVFAQPLPQAAARFGIILQQLAGLASSIGY